MRACMVLCLLAVMGGGHCSLIVSQLLEETAHKVIRMRLCTGHSLVVVQSKEPALIFRPPYRASQTSALRWQVAITNGHFSVSFLALMRPDLKWPDLLRLMAIWFDTIRSLIPLSHMKLFCVYHIFAEKCFINQLSIFSRDRDFKCTNNVEQIDETSIDYILIYIKNKYRRLDFEIYSHHDHLFFVKFDVKEECRMMTWN